MLGESADGSMTVPISNDLMKNWGISVSELHDIALSNMDRVTPPQFTSMSKMIGNMLLDDLPRDMTDEEREEALSAFSMGEDAMYVLTNRQKLNGAVQVLNRDVMDRIIDKIGRDFYILPSSIHEVLIVPAAPDMEVSMLRGMVQEVNQTQVSPEERLSDNVYVYGKNGIQLAM